MKGVILDKSTFYRGDIDLKKLQQHPVEWRAYASTSPDQIKRRIKGCEIIITNKVVLNKNLLASTNCLQLIMLAATGTDNVDLQECRARNITVCNVRHYATLSVVQHTFALMLNLLTNQFRYHQAVTAGAWHNSNVFCLLDYPVVEIENKTLGIIGYGALGKKVAEVAKAFGMSVQICQRPGGKKVPGRISFKQILANSDVLTIHCPLTPDTLNLIGENEFKQMKSNAIIINTARGAIIDSVALVTALKKEQIAGAGIDVLGKEPPSNCEPLLQPNIPNLIVTPHNAWATREARQRLVDQMADILANWLSGHPTNVVS